MPDAAYLYRYSRLTLFMERNLRHAGAILSDIGGRWRALSQGQPTTCNDIPDDLVLEGFSASDLNIESAFRPIAVGLTEVQAGINAALAQFRQVCQQTSRQVGFDIMQTALTHVETAERNLRVIKNLLAPFQRHDPILGNDRTTVSAS